MLGGKRLFALAAYQCCAGPNTVYQTQAYKVVLCVFDPLR